MRRVLSTALGYALLAGGFTALTFATLTWPHVMAWVLVLPAALAVAVGLVAWGYTIGARDERGESERAMRGMRLQVESALAELQAAVNDDFAVWESEIREVS